MKKKLEDYDLHASCPIRNVLDRFGDKWSILVILLLGEHKTAMRFNEVAQGRKNDKIGFFNAKGEWAIEPQFDASRDFKNGYAAAKKNDKWGMINTEGKWVIEPTFEAIKDMELIR